jgi:DNA-binding response OmpR family regulator
MNRILIVESDFPLSEKLYRAFSSIETEVVNCSTMESATALLEEQVFNIAVIDTELVDGNGYDLIYEIELGIYNSKDVQVIAILNNETRPDPIELLERGIADYITKPFSTAVLKSKILTIFNRQQEKHALFSGIRSDIITETNIVNISDRQKVVIANFVFDFNAGEYSVGGRRVELDEVQQVVLKSLVDNIGIVLKKQALVEKLRDSNRLEFMDETVLSSMVMELADRLCAHNYIKIVYGIGYMWIKYEENSMAY